jgi:hypothetical protein
MTMNLYWSVHKIGSREQHKEMQWILDIGLALPEDNISMSYVLVINDLLFFMVPLPLILYPSGEGLQGRYRVGYYNDFDQDSISNLPNLEYLCTQIGSCCPEPRALGFQTPLEDGLSPNGPSFSHPLSPCG